MDINNITELVNGFLAPTDYFLVSASVDKSNRIEIIIDRNEGVSLDFCAELNAFLNEKLDRDVEDYELEVSSAGLTSPFLVKRQYDKNLGNAVVVLTADGRNLKGTLVEAGEEAFAIKYETKEKVEGSKRPVLVERVERIAYADARQVTYDLKF